MKLVVGLGNPGREYQHTRHNAGFMVADELAGTLDVALTRTIAHTRAGIGTLDDEDVMIIKPQTFMNLSGTAVRQFVEKYDLVVDRDLLVIADDIYLPIGTMRIRKQGSSAGHNGMASIIAELGTERFVRLKIGVGDPVPDMTLADYVLSTFLPEERDEMARTIAHAADAICAWVRDGVNAAAQVLSKRS